MHINQLTEKIIGCSFKVHRALGPGFPEKVYQSALLNSLQGPRFTVERECRFRVVFEDKPVGDFHIDLLVNGMVILEVKAVTGPMPRVFAAQLLAYLKAAQLPVGLLINFGNPSCQIKRVIFSSAKSRKSEESILESAESSLR